MDAKWTLPRCRLAVCALLCATFTAQAQAQSAAQQRVETLNAEAMDAYSNLDIEAAAAMLDEAAQLAEQASLSTAHVAQTNLNLGVVLLTGMGDEEGARARFLIALCADPKAAPDPLVSSPDVRAAFRATRKAARSGACPEPAAQAPASASGPEARTIEVSPSAVGLSDIVHTAPSEQEARRPLPLYVEVNPELGAERVVLHYGLAGGEFNAVDMVDYGYGYAFQISCLSVMAPNVAYYIEALDDAGRVVASVASKAEPFVVLVGDGATESPHLPGAPPPGVCAAEECPPGIVCEQRGTRSIGQSCELTSACQPGLVCGDAGTCGLSTDGVEVPERVEPLGEPKRAFVQIGMAMGLAFISAGMEVDRLPQPSEVFIDPTTQTYVVDPVNAPSSNLILPFESQYPQLINGWIPDADSADSAGLYGGSCEADGVVTGPTQARLFPSKFCARVDGSSVAISPALRANVGYFVTDRIAVAAVFRFQLDAGVGTLSNILLGGRGEYMITEPRARGLMFSVFAGLTMGQIQAQPSLAVSNDRSPWIRSGLFGLHAGVGLRYRFTDAIGLFFAPELDLQVPDTLFNIDLPLGVELAFL